MRTRVQESLPLKNYNSFDVAKFVCALMVVMIHVPPFGSSATGVVGWLNFGIQNYIARVAVPLFFVISGFLIFRGSLGSKVDLSYFIRYSKRIFRIYLFWTVVYLPWSIRNFIENDYGILESIVRYVRDFFMTGSYSQLWYLPALIFSVLIVAFLLSRGQSPWLIATISCLLYVIGLFAQSWFGFIKPIQETSPYLWEGMILFKKVIGTTRNGLFEGFFFVTIGMLFAYHKNPFSRRQAFLGFVISLGLLLAEVILLESNELIRSYDLFFFLAPTTVFLFAYLLEVSLPPNPIYRTLRQLSMLIYFLHNWFTEFYDYILPPSLTETSLHFGATLVTTLFVSLLIMQFSQRES